MSSSFGSALCGGDTRTAGCSYLASGFWLLASGFYGDVSAMPSRPENAGLLACKHRLQ